MANWAPQEGYIVPQAITATSTSQKMALGTVVKAHDVAGASGLGAGEFVYAKGVASTAIGSVCTIDEAGVTALASANAKGRIGCAMSANVASQYGWYQIAGKGVAKVKASFADNGVCYLTSTAGSVDDTAVAGDLVQGMMGRSAIDTPATGQAYVELNRPFADDTANDGQ